MNITRYGGFSALSKRLVSVKKSIVVWKKLHRKTAAILSVSLKVALITLPIGVIPVAAQSTVHTGAHVEVNFDKSSGLFSDGLAQIVITAGESNITIDAQKRAAKARAQIVTVSAATTPSAAPSIDEMRSIYVEAGQKYGVPAQLIEAVHQVETGKSWDTSVHSRSGAIGPMQFLSSTFISYCKRTGEGCDITRAKDAIYAASLLLSANYSGSWDSAIMAYNHSIAYVHEVKSIANELGANI